MSSKLDYLSKYTSSSSALGDGEKRKRKQAKKEKKKKKRKNNESTAVSRSSYLATNLVDEDDFPVRDQSDNDDFGNYNDDDEGPVVVAGNVAASVLDNDSGVTAQQTSKSSRGVWKPVATTANDGGTGASNSKSNSDSNSNLRPIRRRRHDSSSSSEGEKIRPQQRHDSSSSDNEDKDNRPLRTRHDSSDDYDDEAKSNDRRRRHNSSSEEEKRSNNTRKYNNQPDLHRGRRRHDSDDETSRESTRRRKRYDSSEDDNEARRKDRKREQESRRRRRNQLSSSDSEEGRSSRGKRNTRRKQQRQRYDSEDGGDNTDRGDSPRRKQRHDSSDEESEAGSDGSREAAARMSSGHKAGLQDYRDFNKSERVIQAKKHKDAQTMVDRHGMGETIYRDKDGRKTAPESTDGDSGPSKAQIAAAAKERLNQGKVQKEAREAKARELMTLQDSGFARYRDDDRLEETLKNEIRKDDPMAKYALSKQRTNSRKSNNNSNGSGSSEGQPPPKPVYKGPQPKANRFGIRPGYRWDGIDRGNEFEDKILAKKFSSARKAEQSYKWSSADM